jgi:prepilin-type N-terminal cleavage/methylation domain-containing protein
MTLNNQIPARRRGFTLVELLVVIAIIGVIVAFVIVGMGGVKKTQYTSTARKELTQIQTALDNYKAKYGVYPPSNHRPNTDYTAGNPNLDRAMFNQLYYELSGTTPNGVSPNLTFVTLGGSLSMQSTYLAGADVNTAFGVGGFVNSTKGSAEDLQAAQNYLPGLSTKQYNFPTTNNGVQTTILVTSVGGPDDTYQPLGLIGINPIRYVYPGVHNPGSYDLWVQLSYKGKLYLVCNWNKNVQVNTPDK